MAVPRRSTSLHARAFRALLALYPAVFRDEYGREMSLVFADRYRDASGAADRLVLWFETIAGVFVEAPKEHARMTFDDVRYALRRLRLSPGFALTSILTLALAIGANTAMFSVLEAVLLRPLPLPSPGELATVWTEQPSQSVAQGRSAYWNIEQWQRESRSFAALGVIDPVSATIQVGEDADQLGLARASANVFTVLGIAPVAGRLYSAQEVDARARVALISERFWQARFGRSAAAIGSRIDVDGMASQIIGVLPESVRVVGDAAVWEPHTLFPDWEVRRLAAGAGSWFVIGRLRAGVTAAQAEIEMTAIARRLDDQLPPADRNRGARVVPLADALTGRGARAGLWMLTAAAFAVLLVAAANVAGLSLARSIGRVPEMAIRAALGASRARMARQLLAESLTLAALAGLVGLSVAAAFVRLVVLTAPAGLPRLDAAALNWRVLAVAFAVSIGTGLLVGLAPTVMMWRRDLRSAGAEGGRGVSGSAASRRLRRVLVAAECALALMLLGGAGLLARSWWNVTHVDPGFATDRVLSMSVATPPLTPDQARAPFYDQVLAAISALPGVDQAGIGSELLANSTSTQAVVVEGDDHRGLTRMQFRRDEVSAGFFEALGAPLLRGRPFTRTDGAGGPRIAIVNQAMAGRLWPGADPIGRRFSLGPPVNDVSWFTVVGVVGDMRRQGLEVEAVPQVFEPLAQNASRRGILVVKTSGDPLAVAPMLRAAVKRVDVRAPVYAVTTLEDRIGTTVAARRLQTGLIAGFAIVALLLTSLGIYGLIQYSVATRTHEIGLRLALGAQAGDIFRMVVREGLVLAAVGVGVGLAGAVWIGYAISSQLFGVAPADPLTLGAVALLLIVVACAASFLPAYRAMRVAPIAALQTPFG